MSLQKAAFYLLDLFIIKLWFLEDDHFLDHLYFLHHLDFGKIKRDIGSKNLKTLEEFV